MATLMVRLPEDLITELREQQVSDEVIDLLIEQTLRAWLRKAPELQAESEAGSSSRFAKSAVEFAEKLIDENRELFERLANL